MTRPRYLNGRILSRQHGGVRRYARQVADRLDCEILQPKSATRTYSGRLWEQTTLARAAADGVLLNVAHSGPMRHRCQVNVIHDLLVLHHPELVHPAYAALLRRQLPAHITSARRLVAVSHEVARQITSRFNIDTPAIDVVPPGIADAFRPGNRDAARQRLDLHAERPVVAALLDPTPRKNSAMVAELLRTLQHARPDVQIVVAGHDRPAAFGRRTDSPRVNRATFVDLGAASDIELATMYQAADVFVSLTMGEGFGLAAVEAARCGAAVITTPVPSITEHAPDGAFTVTSPVQAHTMLNDVLDEPDRGRQVAARAQEALRDLQWGQTAASLDSIMSEVAGT